jgi:hypothetical protein
MRGDWLQGSSRCMRWPKRSKSAGGGEGTMRFCGLLLHKSRLDTLLAEGTDWRFLNELKRELNGVSHVARECRLAAKFCPSELGLSTTEFRLRPDVRLCFDRCGP